MAAVDIGNFIDPKIIEEVTKLAERLVELNQILDSSIQKTSEYKKITSQSSDSNLQRNYDNLISSVENLNRAYTERANAEKQVIKIVQDTNKATRDSINAQKQAMEVVRGWAESENYLINTLAKLKTQLADNKNYQKDLSKERKDGNLTLDEYNDRLATLLERELRLKTELSDVTMAMKVNTKEALAQTGSMDELTQRLGRMRDLYRSLPENLRENTEVGGVLLAGIKELDSTLKDYDATLGNHQRNVGNYAQAGISFRTQINTTREAINSTVVSLQALDSKIRTQRNLVNELRQSEGELSEAYRREASELAKLIDARNTASKSVEQMKAEAIEMQKVYDETTRSVRSAASQTKNIDLVSQSLNTVTAAYQVFQGVMVATGIESENLIEIFAKLQIIQQSVNGVVTIANNLSNRTILGQKLQAAWERIVLTYKQARTKATIQQTAAENASTTATFASAKANNVLAASIKAIGAGFKSLPLIGQIAAVGTALLAVVSLLRNIRNNEEEVSKANMRINNIKKDQLTIQRDIDTKTYDTTTKLKLYLNQLDSATRGSKQWNNAVKEIAQITGKSFEELSKYPDKIKDITDAWVEQYMIRSRAEATFSRISQNYADSQEKLLELESGNVQILSKEWQKTAEQIKGYDQERFDDLYAQRTEELRNRGLFLETEQLQQVAREVLNQLVEEYNDKLLEGVDTEKYLNALAAQRNKTTKSGVNLLDLQLKYYDTIAETEVDRMRLQILRLEEQNRKIAEKYGEMSEIAIASENYTQAAIDKLTRDFLNKRNDQIVTASLDLREEFLKGSEAQYSELERLGNNFFDIGIKNENDRLRLQEDRMRQQFLNERELLDKEIEIYGESYEAYKEMNGEKVLSESEWVKYREQAINLLSLKEQEFLKQIENATEVSERKKQQIRQKYLDAQLAMISQRYTDQENQAIIDAGTNLTINQEKELQNQLGLIRIEAVNAQLAEMDRQKAAQSEYLGSTEEYFKSLGTTEELWNSKYKALQAQETQITKDEAERRKQVRLSELKTLENFANTVTDSFISIGNALSEGLQNEQRRIKIQKQLALAQVAIQQGLATAYAITAATKPGGSWITAAAQIVTAIGTITTHFIRLRNTINSARIYNGNDAIQKYAEGTLNHPGGPALTGEAGPEIINTPGIKPFIVDKPTIFPNMKKGTQVIPFDKIPEYTSSYSNNPDLTELYQRIDATNDKLDTLCRKPTVQVNASENLYYHIVKGSGKSRLLNSSFNF